jgi:hypothetical protein
LAQDSAAEAAEDFSGALEVVAEAEAERAVGQAVGQAVEQAVARAVDSEAEGLGLGD